MVRAHLLGFIAISSSIVVTRSKKYLTWFEINDLYQKQEETN